MTGADVWLYTLSFVVFGTTLVAPWVVLLRDRYQYHDFWYMWIGPAIVLFFGALFLVLGSFELGASDSGPGYTRIYLSGLAAFVGVIGYLYLARLAAEKIYIRRWERSHGRPFDENLLLISRAATKQA
jgi:hypothetical protein